MKAGLVISSLLLFAAMPAYAHSEEVIYTSAIVLLSFLVAGISLIRIRAPMKRKALAFIPFVIGLVVNYELGLIPYQDNKYLVNICGIVTAVCAAALTIWLQVRQKKK